MRRPVAGRARRRGDARDPHAVAELGRTRPTDPTGAADDDGAVDAPGAIAGPHTPAGTRHRREAANGRIADPRRRRRRVPDRQLRHRLRRRSLEQLRAQGARLLHRTRLDPQPDHGGDHPVAGRLGVRVRHRRAAARSDPDDRRRTQHTARRPIAAQPLHLVRRHRLRRVAVLPWPGDVRTGRVPALVRCPRRHDGHLGQPGRLPRRRHEHAAPNLWRRAVTEPRRSSLRRPLERRPDRRPAARLVARRADRGAARDHQLGAPADRRLSRRRPRADRRWPVGRRRRATQPDGRRRLHAPSPTSTTTRRSSVWPRRGWRSSSRRS